MRAGRSTADKYPVTSTNNLLAGKEHTGNTLDVPPLPWSYKEISWRGDYPRWTP